jgi:FMN phosphatase YigB (HAD superfamily)
MSKETKALLLDIGGVLVHDPMHELLDEMSSLSEKSYQELKTWYEENLRYPLWSGSIDEDTFWAEILLYSEAGYNMDHWREYVLSSCRPLAAAARIKDLLGVAPISAISNHRHEWIRPVLNEWGIDKYLEKIFISSETGEVKPDPEAIEYALNDLNISPEEAIFVDDQERNTKSAEEMGLRVILADPDGDWIDEIC